MNEVLYEETAFPVGYAKQKIYLIICKVVTWLFFLTAAFFVFLAIYFTPVTDGMIIVPLIFAVWFVLAGVLFIWLRKKFYNCYDFIFISGEVRIIKVINTKKRKRILIFDSKDVIQVGRYGSESFEKLAKSPDMKRLYVPSNKTEYEGKPKYYIGVYVDGVKYLLVLECTEKLLKHILQFAGKPVLEKEFK